MTDAANERWRRFGILDALLLQAGIALGVGLMVRSRADAVDNYWPAQAGLVELLLVGLILGVVFSGPLVLLAQCVFLGRRTRLNVGEYLWLSPIASWCLVVGGSHLYKEFLAIFGIWGVIVLQTMCMLIAPARLSMLYASEHPTKAAWTDTFGCVACLLLGGLVFYVIMFD